MTCLAENRWRKGGFVLPLVLGILLCLTLYGASLLLIPGGIRRHAGNVAREVQKIYDAESAILLHSRQVVFDDEKLPAVQERDFGPYCEICSGKICGYGIRKFYPRHYGEYHEAIEKYRNGLQKRILGMPHVLRFSGNRRIFSLDRSLSLAVDDGDLLLDVNSGDSISSVNLDVDGNVVVSGNVTYDTLRIHSRGNVSLKGRVSVNYLEVAAGDYLEMKGDFRFRGFGTAWREIRLENHVQGIFPSMLVAIGKNGAEVNLLEKARVAGLLIAPSGSLNAIRQDSLDLVLPCFLDGEMSLFESRIVK